MGPRTRLGVILATFVALILSTAADARFVRYTTVRDEKDGCGMYPSDVFDEARAGWGDCRLRSAGESPLWKGLTMAGARRQVRFTFNEGHGRYTRVIDFVELADGSGEVRRETITPLPGHWLRVDERHHDRVSAEDVRRLNALADASGLWKFDVGTWNHQDPDWLYFDCESLDMERIDAGGYRFSTVFISCSRPKKLVPLVDFLTGLAGLKADDFLY
ncbi:MAG TPA: hypothetical protein VGF77_05520 [Allosphingosinicella sp.]|jgi:hypothetical protein